MPMAGTQHLEIERKYDVGEQAEIPDLSGLSGVSSVNGPEQHELAADYFDPPDLRLAAAGVTHRRRTGGDDEGCHLKLPAKKLQTALGDHHDLVVARDLLRRVGIESHLAGDNGFTYGRLHRLFQARAERLERRWPEAWSRVEPPRPRRWG